MTPTQVARERVLAALARASGFTIDEIVTRLRGEGVEIVAVPGEGFHAPPLVFVREAHT